MNFSRMYVVKILRLQVNPRKQLKLFYLLQTALGLHYIALQKFFKIREAIFNLPGQIIGYTMERKHAQKAHPMHDGYQKPYQTNNLIVNKRPALRPNSGTETTYWDNSQMPYFAV